MPEVVLTQEQMTECDREPIHVLGFVQPFGALVALDPVTLEVGQASGTTTEFFGLSPEEMAGRSFLDYLPARSGDAFIAATGDESIEDNPTYFGALPVNAKGPFHIVVHRHDGLVIVEAEPTAAGESGEARTLPRRMLRALESAQGSRAYYDAVVREAKALTGFDRVMLYRFAEDGSGLVVAEAVEPHLEPFLGLNYPASDIPKQARRLFALNTVRLYPDVDYDPSFVVPNIHPTTGRPLDMSYCVLRGVSKVHTKYLQNMGVKATLSLAITRGEDLWGLIACHHYSVRTVPYPVRTACEFLSSLVSLQVADKEAQDDSGYRTGMGERLERLTRRLFAHPEPAVALTEGEETLLDLIDVGGVAFASGNEIALLGQTPDEESVAGLVQWLGENQKEPLWHPTDLSSEYPAAKAYLDRAAGLLSAQVAPRSETYVLWFLPEQRQTIDWAGNPEKPVSKDDEGRLSPRGSFELWQTTVAGRSRPWKADEIAIADSLRSALVEALVKRTDEIVRLNLELERRNEDLDTFAHITAHDLKEPLRGIRNYSQFFAEDYADKVDDEGRDQLATIGRLAARMETLLDSLLHFARLTREEHQTLRCDLGKAVSEAKGLIASMVDRRNAQVIVEGDLPEVSGDEHLLIETFVNLFTNALKYNDSPNPQIVVSARREDNRVVVSVRDNGIGIPDRHLHTIFLLFKRLHPKEAYDGGTGMGLTIVKRAVERLGGRVRVESKVGEGSTFSLELIP